jgi:hypothetical protein
MAKRGSGNKARVPMYRERPPNCEQCVFNIDIETCGACVGAMKVIACIEDSVVIRKILDHLKQKGKANEPNGLSESRAPPVGLQTSLFN